MLNKRPTAENINSTILPPSQKISYLRTPVLEYYYRLGKLYVLSYNLCTYTKPMVRNGEKFKGNKM